MMLMCLVLMSVLGFSESMSNQSPRCQATEITLKFEETERFGNNNHSVTHVVFRLKDPQCLHHSHPSSSLDVVEVLLRFGNRSYSVPNECISGWPVDIGSVFGAVSAGGVGLYLRSEDEMKSREGEIWAIYLTPVKTGSTDMEIDCIKP